MHPDIAGSSNVCGENDVVPLTRAYFEPMIIDSFDISIIHFRDSEFVLVDLDLEFGKSPNIDDSKTVGLIRFPFECLKIEKG